MKGFDSPTWRPPFPEPCMREPGVHAELQPRAARVRVPAHAPRTRPKSGRPSSKRTEWGARPYACTRSRPVDPDRRLLSDTTRCNSAAGYRHARGSLLVRSRVFHTRPRVRFPSRAPTSSRVRFPPRARSLEGEVCVVQTPVPKTGWRASVRVRLLHLPPWKTISRRRERRLLNGWTPTGCGSTPPASAHRFHVSHAPSQ